MDTTTEAIFKSRLKQFAHNKTMLVVTHRSSLLELVDRVLVLDGGRLVADGPKEKVLDALRKGRIRRVDS